jgi:[ribosomal protein S5]-alanine N-acetyltransferase
MVQEPQAPTSRQSHEALIPSAAAGRVTLRPATRADEHAFVELVSASTDLHGPWMSLAATPEEFQAYLTRYERPGEESLLVCLRDSGAIAGLVNINSMIRGRFQSASVSYAAFAPTAGRGYMTEGLGLAVLYAFEELRLHRLEANIQPGNQASLNLVRRLGFRREGYSPDMLFIDGAWRDHERWAITAAMAGTAAEPHPSRPAR